MSKISDLFNNATKISYSRDEIIVRPEDKPHGVYFIESGYVKSYGVTKFGDVNIHLIRKFGEILPLIWTFSDLHRDIYYQALTDVDVLRISKSRFLEATKKDIELNKEIIDQLVQLYILHAKRIDTLEYRSAYERMVSLLLNLGERLGERNGNKVSINIPLRQHELADSSNMSRETASRELSKLEKQKFINYDNHQIEIINLKKMEDLI